MGNSMDYHLVVLRDGLWDVQMVVRKDDPLGSLTAEQSAAMKAFVLAEN